MTHIHRPTLKPVEAPALKADFAKILQTPYPYHQAGNTQAGLGPNASLNDRLAAVLPSIPADQRDRLIAAVTDAGSWENLPGEYQKMLA